jgi:molecular chaperone HscB
MNLDFSQNFFSLFGLPTSCRVDAAKLEVAYRELQSTVHPDKFAHLPEADRRVSMQWATRVNEAYRTLKQPLARAQYLLGLHGIDVQAESNTAMPADFLMEQMEWREGVAEARAADDVAELEKLHARLSQQQKLLLAEIEGDIDDRKDYAAASSAVRRLMFMDKLQHDIRDALEALES